MNAILGVYTELDKVTNLQCDYLELLEKCEGLETELSKSKMMSKSFESVQKHAINLELELQQCKEKIKNDMLFKLNKTKDFCKEREQYFKIKDLKAQLQDKGIVINSLGSQLETQKTQFLNEIDRLSKEYYYADHMNAILGVYTELDEVTNLQCDYLEFLKKCEGLQTWLSKSKIMSKSFKSVQKHAINLELKDLKAQLQDKGIIIRVILTTSVSRPQLKSNPMGDRVMRNNSQGKK
nr:hypothetical protein [Tanacetum cinerariifolium]